MTGSRVLAALLVLLLSACGDARDADGSDDDPEPVRSSVTPSGEPDRAEAQDRLEVGVQRILDEQRTTFAYRTTYDGDAIMRLNGVADVEKGWSVRMAFAEPGKPTKVIGTMSAVSTIDGSTWMQMQQWSGSRRGCWLALGPRQVPLGITGLQAGEPGWISILPRIEAVGPDDTDEDLVRAEVDLASAVVYVQSQLMEKLVYSQDQLAQGTVELDLGFDEDRLQGVVLRGSSFAQALKDVGVQVGPQYTAFLDGATYEVEFPRDSFDMAISAPPEDLVTTVGEPGCR